MDSRGKDEGGARGPVSRAEAEQDAPPVAPTPPDLEACCGSGCNPCVFDVYDEAIERYIAAFSAWQERHAPARLTMPLDKAEGA